jgi:hypothetical protein
LDALIPSHRMNHTDVIQNLNFDSYMVSKPVEDQSLQSWFRSDFLDDHSIPKNEMPIRNNNLNGIEHNLSPSINGDQTLQSWFKSDFMDHIGLNGSSSGHHRLKDYNVESVSDTKIKQLSIQEQARRDSLTEAVVLLRSLTEDQWVCFDLGEDLPIHTTIDTTSTNINGALSNELDDTTRIVDMLSELLATDIVPDGRQLTATEYNYSLARMAIATDVAPDEILALLMQTHHQMNELAKAGFIDSGPNSVTHEILLLALVRRFSAFHNAIDLVIALSKSSNFSWSPKTLQAASELCERKDLLRMSRDLTNIIKTLDVTRLKVPKRVFISLINVYKDNDARHDAIEMLKLGLKVKVFLFHLSYDIYHLFLTFTIFCFTFYLFHPYCSKQSDDQTNFWMKYLSTPSNGRIGIVSLGSLTIALFLPMYYHF